MAGVFSLIKGPQRQLVVQHGKVQRADPRSLELQAALEILAEVFDIETCEVSEMIGVDSRNLSARELTQRTGCGPVSSC